MANKRKRDGADGAVSKTTSSKARKQEPTVAFKKPSSQATSLPKQAVSQASSAPSPVQANKATTATTTTPSQAGTNGTSPAEAGASPSTTTIQIITGSYERVLHGFTATIAPSLLQSHDLPNHGHENENGSDASNTPNLPFADTFLFNAHASAIRCLALSPPSETTPKLTLATGSTDERVNLYSLSTVPPKVPSKSNPQLPTLHSNPIASNPQNRLLGSLMHHSAPVSQLHFPTRAKLLSGAMDNHIAITRTRDWTPLSTIKAPIPKQQGRPSGDTAAPGEVPCGINSFAIHPSMKLMVSVGRGEKCMRLWNLVTGKKAGVLNFHRGILDAVGEGRFGSGEARKVVWDQEGEEFVVGFERGCVVFGIDSQPKGKLVPTPRTKIQEVKYVPFPTVEGNDEKGDAQKQKSIVAISTEDGRIMFYDTGATTPSPSESEKDTSIPACALIAQLGGPAAGITSRIKDFEILPIPNSSTFVIVTASSDGSVRFWTLTPKELLQKSAAQREGKGRVDGEKAGFEAKQVGSLIGTYSNGLRITCLKAFVMTGKAEDVEEEEEQGEESSSSEGESE